MIETGGSINRKEVGEKRSCSSRERRRRPDGRRRAERVGSGLCGAAMEGSGAHGAYGAARAAWRRGDGHRLHSYWLPQAVRHEPSMRRMWQDGHAPGRPLLFGTMRHHTCGLSRLCEGKAPHIKKVAGEGLMVADAGAEGGDQFYRGAHGGMGPGGMMWLGAAMRCGVEDGRLRWIAERAIRKNFNQGTNPVLNIRQNPF